MKPKNLLIIASLIVVTLTCGKKEKSPTGTENGDDFSLVGNWTGIYGSGILGLSFVVNDKGNIQDLYVTGSADDCGGSSTVEITHVKNEFRIASDGSFGFHIPVSSDSLFSRNGWVSVDTISGKFTSNTEVTGILKLSYGSGLTCFGSWMSPTSWNARKDCSLKPEKGLSRGRFCSDSSTVIPTDSSEIPAVTTAEVSAITHCSAQSGGTVTDDGGAPITIRGVCWSTNQNPTLSASTTNEGSGVGSFTSYITGLTPVTTYYVRAYTTNSAGTGYGNIMSFTTEEGPPTDTVTDMDGNTYQTVKIGDQWWMAENLRVRHYCNGDSIPNVKSGLQWPNLLTGAYCAYQNNESIADIYGYLYNWYAVSDSRDIAPEGWHIATDEEWQGLVDYLGGSSVAGGKMKEAGTAHWNSPNTGATNESGFTALPAGSYGGFFGLARINGVFWSATESDIGNPWFYALENDNSEIDRKNVNGKEIGFSVRCIKD